MKKAKFTRSVANKQKNISDEAGTVRIVVMLIDHTPHGHRPKKGNICRSFSVANSTVSVVAEAINKSLF